MRILLTLFLPARVAEVKLTDRLSTCMTDSDGPCKLASRNLNLMKLGKVDVEGSEREQEIRLLLPFPTTYSTTSLHRIYLFFIPTGTKRFTLSTALTLIPRVVVYP